MAWLDLDDGIDSVFAEAANAGGCYGPVGLAFGELATDGEVAAPLQKKARYWLETLALREGRPRFHIEPIEAPVPRQTAAVRAFWERQRRRPGTSLWTEEKDHRLMLLAVGEGRDWDDVAEELGHTKSACITRYSAIKARLQLTIHRKGARVVSDRGAAAKGAGR